MTGIETKLASTLGSYLAKNFAARIVERWTKHRSAKMLEGLVAGLTEENSTGIKGNIDDYLSRILHDDSHSEVLFDAYRRICFARSKTIGPRIIGYLTAKIISEGRMALPEDEEIFEAAERLSDPDLIEFLKQYHEEAAKADKEPNGLPKNEWRSGAIIVPWHSEEFYSNTGSFKGVDISPLDLNAAYGRWAGELGRIGFIRTSINRGKIDYEENPTETYEFIARFEPNCKVLAEMIVRCLPPKS